MGTRQQPVNSSTRLLGPRSSGRNKQGARVYFFILSVVFFVLLLVSVIALGAFAIVQKRVADFASQHGSYGSDQRCILYSHSHDKTDKGVPLVEFSNLGVCAYVLWGQVSIAIVAFVWLAYYVVLLAFGPKVLSPLRILDFLAFSLTLIFSFALSISISAGLTVTCNIFNSREQCHYSYLTDRAHNVEISYYGPLSTAESSSWVTAVILFGLTLWNFILMVIYCKSGTSKPIRTKEVRKGGRHCSPSVSTESSESSESEDEKLLTDVAKPSNPFSNT